MDIQITLAGRGDRSARIYRQLRDAVLDGRLRPGDRLPATRDLAGQLGVSRNTVAAAYDSLTAEGFVAARVGDGTYVEAVAERRSAGRRQAPRGREVAPSPRWQGLAAGGGPGLGVPRAGATVRLRRRYAGSRAVPVAGLAACGVRRAAPAARP